MEKFECQKLMDMFNEIEFIEHVEQVGKNARKMALVVIPLGSINTIQFPDGLYALVMETLGAHKETLKEQLKTLQLVDATPEPEPEPEPDTDTDTDTDTEESGV